MRRFCKLCIGLGKVLRGGTVEDCSRCGGCGWDKEGRGG